MMLRFAIFSFLALAFAFVACKKKNIEPTTPVKEPVLQISDLFELQVPEGFDQPKIPAENPLNEKKVALGKKLFYDPVLSKNSSLSGASCHRPELAFTDGLSMSNGANNQPLSRNSPTLVNVVYNTAFMHDGGPKTLENQIMLPFDNELEFNLSLPEAADKLAKIDGYRKAFQETYGTAPTAKGIIDAISSFERTLLSGNSKYDQYTFQGQQGALNASELRGNTLFFSKELSCSECHSGFNFTNYSLQNNGTFELGSDSGRYKVTRFINDIGLFKVPTLRNLSVTKPYMHDGRFSTLMEVILHYESGGHPYPTRSNLVRGFSLTDGQKKDLEAFLLSLTDEEFLQNPDHRP